jgi:hypothetical protein
LPRDAAITASRSWPSLKSGQPWSGIALRSSSSRASHRENGWSARSISQARCGVMYSARTRGGGFGVDGGVLVFAQDQVAVTHPFRADHAVALLVVDRVPLDAELLRERLLQPRRLDHAGDGNDRLAGEVALVLPRVQREIELVLADDGFGREPHTAAADHHACGGIIPPPAADAVGVGEERELQQSSIFASWLAASCRERSGEAPKRTRDAFQLVAGLEDLAQRALIDVVVARRIRGRRGG